MGDKELRRFFRRGRDAMAQSTSLAASLADIVALPEIGGLLFDRRPAFVWQADGRRLLFANSAGVAWFGATSLAALREREFSSANPAVKRIERLAHTLPSSGARIEFLRFSLGVVTSALPSLCQRLRTEAGDNVILIVGLDATAPAEPLSRRARRAVAELAESGDALILDEDGEALAATDPALAKAARSIFTKLHDGAEERTVWIDGARRNVAIVAAQTDEGRVYVVLPGPGVAEEEPAAGERPTAKAIEPAATSAPEPEAEPEPVKILEPRAEEPIRLPTAEKPAEVEVQRPATEKAAATFVFRRQSSPVRFVFTVDAEQRLTMLSHEFAGVVGQKSADVVGLKWAEIGPRLGIDADGAMRDALARRDTWSGITLFWPVDDSDLRVPVDLAALPVFSRERAFEGFRGFGVARTADAATDGVQKTHPAEAVEPDAPVRPSADIHVLPAPQPANVVRLPTKTDTPTGQQSRLSGTEQAAFQQIAEALNGGADVAAESGNAGAAASLPPTAIDIAILDRIPIGLLAIRDDRAIYANRAFLDLVGYPDIAAFEKSGGLGAMFRGGQVTERADHLSAWRADGSSVRVESRMVSVPWDGGTALMLSFRAAPEPPAERSTAPPPGLTDELKAARARIGELDTILDTATDGVFVIDGAGRIVTFNRAAEALFGIDAALVLGSPFTDLLAEESRRAALDYLDGLASNGVASVLNDGREVIGRVPNGGLIPLFMTMGRLSTSGKFCAVLRDITHWKRAEEELVSAKRAAEQANEQKSEFLAKVSHEIRTPLNAVIGFSEVMMEERFGPVGNERYRQYLRDIHLSGSHLMSLINDLLDLSKIEAGKVELSFESVRVNDIIQDCVALMQPQANRERIIIRTSLSAGVPNVVADPRSLRQIILNLLSNAIKFTRPGGQVIVSTAMEENGEVVIRVRDTGVGMSEKDIETALTPFRQVTTSDRTRFDGTGLGLPLTKALVEANRAAFAIDSAVDQGTLVKITFPTTRVLAE
jgi:PAS domain S-box-containing protein